MRMANKRAICDTFILPSLREVRKFFRVKYSNGEGGNYDIFFRVSLTFLSRRRTPKVDGILLRSVLQVESPAVVRNRTMALSKCNKRLDPTSVRNFVYHLGRNRSGILI